MKFKNLLAAVLTFFAISSFIQAEKMTCTLTTGNKLWERKGVKGYLTSSKGTLLTQIPSTQQEWAKVKSVEIAKNTDPDYDKALLLTYDHKKPSGFFASLVDRCTCQNNDLPQVYKNICENSSQGIILALSKDVKHAKQAVTGHEKISRENKLAQFEAARKKATDDLKKANEDAARAEARFKAAKTAAAKQEAEQQATSIQSELDSAAKEVADEENAETQAEVDYDWSDLEELKNQQ